MNSQSVYVATYNESGDADPAWYCWLCMRTHETVLEYGNGNALRQTVWPYILREVCKRNYIACCAVQNLTFGWLRFLKPMKDLTSTNPKSRNCIAGFRLQSDTPAPIPDQSAHNINHPCTSLSTVRTVKLLWKPGLKLLICANKCLPTHQVGHKMAIGVKWPLTR